MRDNVPNTTAAALRELARVDPERYAELTDHRLTCPTCHTTQGVKLNAEHQPCGSEWFAMMAADVPSGTVARSLALPERDRRQLIIEARASVEAGFWLFHEEGLAVVERMDEALDALSHAVDDVEAALKEARARRRSHEGE